MKRQLSGTLTKKLSSEVIQTAPNAVRASGFASIKLAAKHAAKNGNKGWYNFNKNMQDHIFKGGMTQALKEKLAEEIIWMDLVGSPAVLSSIVNDKDVIGKAAW